MSFHVGAVHTVFLSLSLSFFFCCLVQFSWVLDFGLLLLFESGFTLYGGQQWIRKSRYKEMGMVIFHVDNRCNFGGSIVQLLAHTIQADFLSFRRHCWILNSKAFWIMPVGYELTSSSWCIFLLSTLFYSHSFFFK